VPRLALLVLVPLALAVIWSSSTAAAAPNLKFPWPAGSRHRINSQNATYDCYYHQESIRYAIDFEFSIGQAVAAVAGGTISARERTADERDNFIEVDHGGDYKTRYLHLRSDADGGPWPPWMEVGVPVAQGQLLGYSGQHRRLSGPPPFRREAVRRGLHA